MLMKQPLQLENGNSGSVLLTDIPLKQVGHTNSLLAYPMVLVATEWILEVPVYELKQSTDMACTVKFPSQVCFKAWFEKVLKIPNLHILKPNYSLFYYLSSHVSMQNFMIKCKLTS